VTWTIHSRPSASGMDRRTGRDMRCSEQGDVVRVPFPHSGRDTPQQRPAPVVSNGVTGEADFLLWVVMIMSAANRPWAGADSLACKYHEAGLPIPSVVRPAKIAAIETGVCRGGGWSIEDRRAGNSNAIFGVSGLAGLRGPGGAGLWQGGSRCSGAAGTRRPPCLFRTGSWLSPGDWPGPRSWR
jgi:mRNA interferase MazF